MSKNIEIVEVGPRDGLQNEKVLLTLAQKLQFVQLLADAGHTRIEVGALVNAAKVPQMAESKELCMQLKQLSSRRSKVRFSVLVPNEHGYQDALEVDMKEIGVFIATSNTFNQKNINATTAEALQRFKMFVADARKRKIFVRAYVSTAFGCPYEGKVAHRDVLRLCEQLSKLGVQELSICDTIGVAVPRDVQILTKQLIKHFKKSNLAMHFHDTRGTALANVYAALLQGITIFDSSSGGLGGCPFAPHASGNLATDDLLYMLQQMQLKTTIDLSKQLSASRFIQECIGQALPSRYLQAAE